MFTLNVSDCAPLPSSQVTSREVIVLAPLLVTVPAIVTLVPVAETVGVEIEVISTSFA